MRHDQISRAARSFSVLLMLAAAFSPWRAHAQSGDILDPGAMTGAWFDPAFEGAGFLIEALPDDGAVVYWFTYDEAGGQQWFVGVGSVDGRVLIVEELQTTRGARFGDSFDPDDVERIPVGSLRFEFGDCASAVVSFVVDGSVGAQDLRRLTSIAGHGCSAAEQRLVAPNEINQTGSWFNPDRSGEGLIVQVLDEETAFVNWFTYDPEGQQAWFTGIGRMAGRYLHVGELLETGGGRFGPDHDPAAVVRTRRGQLELELGCDAGTLGYDTDLGSGRIDLVRLTRIAGLGCREDRFVTPTAEQLVGTWTSNGFGMAAEITASSFALYQHTAASCLPVLAGTADELAEAVKGAELAINESNNRVRFLGLDAVSPVFFDRQAGLPSSCRGGGTDFTPDPRHNFEVLAATFDELYAAFDLRGVDWDRQVQTFRPQVSAGMDEQTLFNVMRDTLAPLDDGHVSLISPFASFSPGASEQSRALFARAGRARVDQIIEGSYLAGSSLTAINRAFRFGMLDATTGYLQVSRFLGLFPGVDTQQALGLYADRVDEVLGWFADQGARALVIDVRRNQGGDSKFGFELARRFYGERSRLVFSERRPTGTGLSRTLPTAIGPASRIRFDGPVAVLTSPITASAAEVFTLALRARPGTVVVGERSRGVLSRTERVLPNGWTVSVTPGVVYAPDGSVYEAAGIPVDVVAVTFPESDLAAGVDRGIDAALAVLSL